MKIKKIFKKCGKIIFMDKMPFRMRGKKQPRAPRSVQTTEVQKEINRRVAARKLLELLQNNFSNGIHLVLTYKEEPASKAEAKRELDNFLRRLRYAYQKQGKELKYVLTTEYLKKRIHHHLVIDSIPEISVTRIQNEIWKNGLVRNTPFEEEGYYIKLAEYLIKETSKTFDSLDRICGKRFTHSRNLILPEPVEEISEGDENDLLDIPLADTIDGVEYELIKGSEYIGKNPFTGLPYVTYAMREIQKE